jgi:hypothetical protein
MASIALPTVFPAAEIQEIIQVVASGGISADRTEIFADLWVLVGYFGAQLLPQIPGPTPLPARATALAPEPTVINDAEAADILQKMCDAQAHPDKMRALNINWKQLLQWALALLAAFSKPAPAPTT